MLKCQLCHRIGDDDLERFLASTKNDIERCAMLVKRNVKWRETFYFLSPFELENFSSLLFWHGYDSAMRPSLVVRIGLAYSHLSAKERPRFIQAICKCLGFHLQSYLGIFENQQLNSMHFVDLFPTSNMTSFCFLLYGHACIFFIILAFCILVCCSSVSILHGFLHGRSCISISG
jgi:hypothetical protein